MWPETTGPRIQSTGFSHGLALRLFLTKQVLTAADPENHINKTKFSVPFVCGAKNLGEALRRIGEGASMIRMKGRAGTGNLIEACRHTREIFKEIRRLKSMDEDEVCGPPSCHPVSTPYLL